MEVMRNLGLVVYLREGREHRMGLWDAGYRCFLTGMCVCMESGVGSQFSSPGVLSKPVIEPRSPTLQADSLLAEP